MIKFIIFNITFKYRKYLRIHYVKSCNKGLYKPRKNWRTFANICEAYEFTMIYLGLYTTYNHMNIFDRLYF